MSSLIVKSLGRAMT